MSRKFFATITVVLILCQVAFARPTTEASLQRYQQLYEHNLEVDQCVEELREDLRYLIKDFGEWILEILQRVERLRNLRETCDNIPISDPPRPWELIQREACERALQAAVAVEVARLGVELTEMLVSYPVIVRDSLERFLICAANESSEGYQIGPKV